MAAKEGAKEGAKALLMEMLKSRRESTYKYQRYLSTPREYYPGENLYMREVHVVMEIGEQGLDNVGELSERLGITRGAVSQYLKKLEEKGFVRRIQDRKDKRQFSVELTQKGKELFKIHNDYDKEQYAKVCPLFAEFTVEELEVACRFEQKFKAFTDELERAGRKVAKEFVKRNQIE